LLLLWISPSFAWHENTHHLINEAAFQALPSDFPSFLKEEQSWIVYQVPEPDRWKSKEAETLKKDSGPEGRSGRSGAAECSRPPYLQAPLPLLEGLLDIGSILPIFWDNSRSLKDKVHLKAC